MALATLSFSWAWMIRVKILFWARKPKHFLRVTPPGFSSSVKCYLSLKRKAYQLKLTKLRGRRKGSQGKQTLEENTTKAFEITNQSS